jgi:AbrB family looped-hinge helix DNA binding protein
MPRTKRKSTITVSSKGQLVLPAFIRTLAEISEGDELTVEYLATTGEVRLKKTLRTAIW